MLAYSDYDKLKKLLKDGKYDKLDEYLDKLCYKTYLETARKALLKYETVKGNPYYGYVEGEKLLLSDYCSVFKLNSDEILTPNRRETLKAGKKTFDNAILLKLLNAYNNIINADKIDIGKIEKVQSFRENVYDITSDDGSIVSSYSVKLFDCSNSFLGRNASFKLVPYLNIDNIYAIFAESEKGTGVVLPIQKVKN